MPKRENNSVTRAIETWFRTNARPLPWRTTPRKPWPSFISEAMLQQTQVARVLEKFEPFLKQFPTPRALAQADEDTVLAAWQGLGYYRRARNLQTAAQQIVTNHNSRIPKDVPTLLTLKGVGRYTAGAIASIVYNQPEPIVDGNVVRLLIRLDGKELRAGQPDTEKWTWARATQLVRACASPALFNEGMMELGARICTHRNPKCNECPLHKACAAHAAGTPEAYPLPKIQAKKTDVHHAIVIIRDAAGRVLLEKRPPTGLWASMWQPVGIEHPDHPPTATDLTAAIGAEMPAKITQITHDTSHRRVHLALWSATAAQPSAAGKWVAPADLHTHALPNPHRRLLRTLLALDISEKEAGKIEQSN